MKDRWEKASEQLDNANKLLRELQVKLAVADEVAAVIQESGRIVQTEVCKTIEKVVNECLESVFDSPYTLKATVDKLGERSKLTFLLCRGGECVDPIDATGGGVVDVVSFGLRLACLVLSENRKVLFLDEPFHFISSQYKKPAAELLATVAEKWGVTILLVTHVDEIDTVSSLVLGG